MAFTNLTVKQTTFLEQYLRGTGRELTSAQAASNYGIYNLRARLTEMRQAGLKVNARENYNGRTAYSVSARDLTGSRANVFA